MTHLPLYFKYNFQKSLSITQKATLSHSGFLRYTKSKLNRERSSWNKETKSPYCLSNIVGWSQSSLSYAWTANNRSNIPVRYLRNSPVGLVSSGHIVDPSRSLQPPEGSVCTSLRKVQRGETCTEVSEFMAL